MEPGDHRDSDNILLRPTRSGTLFRPVSATSSNQSQRDHFFNQQDTSSARPRNQPSEFFHCQDSSPLNQIESSENPVVAQSDRYRNRSSFRQVASQWWLWELLACTATLLAGLGIVVFLKHYDGRPQPQWPSYITVNSVLSLFTALLKAPLLVTIGACLGQAKWTHYRSGPHPLTDFVAYDEASRGPLGSIELLWVLKGKYIASLGAILTILAIGIDPTVQQMVTIRSKTTNTTLPATLGRAQSYLQFGPAEQEGQMSLPTVEMIGAIYTGMFYASGDSQGSSLDIVLSCPTGNCTYPAFQSLAICSTCEDITHAVRRTCHNATFQENVGEPGSTVTQQIYCELSLSNGLKVNDSSAGIDNIYGAFASSGYLPPVGQFNIGNTILNFSRIRGPVEDQSGKVIQQTTANQCSLYWCVNTYQSRVDNGQTQENVTESWKSYTTDWWFNSETANGERLDLVPPGVPSAIASGQHSHKSNFTVDFLANNGLSSWLAEKSTLSNSQAPFVEDHILSWGPDITNNDTSSSSDLLKAFRDTNNPTLFSNIAKSMTRNIRSVNSSQQTTFDSLTGFLDSITGVGPSNGTAHTLEIYVSVRWPWLTFAASLIVAAIVLLALTVIDTAQDGIAGWKSSPLPLLLQTVQEAEEHKSDRPLKSTTPRDIVDMERLARKIAVQLSDAGAGSLRLVRTSPGPYSHGDEGDQSFAAAKSTNTASLHTVGTNTRRGGYRNLASSA